MNDIIGNLTLHQILFFLIGIGTGCILGMFIQWLKGCKKCQTNEVIRL